MTDAVLLRVRGLRTGHPGAAALPGPPLDLDLVAGEVLALLGPNGVGKTTLLRTLLGGLPPHAGTVQRDPGLGLAGLGFVAQSLPAAGELRLREYVRLGGLGGREAGRADAWGPGAPTAHERARVDAALDRVGLAEQAGRRLGQLSGGERQLAALARVLVQQARVVLLDEPLASLDLANQSRVLECLAQLGRAGLAVVFSTHDPAHALRIGTRALLLQGHDQRLGAPAELLDSATLSALYGVPVQRVPLPGGGWALGLPSPGEGIE